MSYPVLLVLSGLFQGSEYEIIERFKIGRHPDNQLQLTDKKVSRFHAIIEPMNGGFQIRDLKSRNGTWVNGSRVLTETLTHGDEIRIGRTRLAFHIQSAPETSVPDGPSSQILSPKTTVQVRLRSSTEEGLTWAALPEKERPGETVQDQLSRLQLLYRSNLLLSSELELEGIFRRLLDQLFGLLPADRGVIFLVEPRTRELGVKYSLARSGEAAAGNIFVSRTILDQVLQEGLGLLIEDTRSDERFKLIESVVEQGIRSALCVPLLHQREALGMIYLDALGTASAFHEDDLHLLSAMAAPAALQVRNLQYLDQVARSYLDTMQALSNAIEARDHYTVGHTWRVTRIALALAKRLGWTSEQSRYAEMGGILHDIGKIAVEDSILRKSGPLTREEYSKMQLHPEHGARIIKDVNFLKPVIPYVLFHQERWDGKGYPFQLKGEDVPVEGRLLTVPDAFDAMTSHRPYRASRPPEEAVEEIKKNRGRQFDPMMVDTFLETWEQGEIVSIIQDYARSGQTVACPFCSTHIPLGEDPREGVILECPVCQKDCVLLRDGEQWWGDLA